MKEVFTLNDTNYSGDVSIGQQQQFILNSGRSVVKVETDRFQVDKGTILNITPNLNATNASKIMIGSVENSEIELSSDDDNLDNYIQDAVFTGFSYDIASGTITIIKSNETVSTMVDTRLPIGEATTGDANIALILKYGVFGMSARITFSDDTTVISTRDITISDIRQTDLQKIVCLYEAPFSSEFHDITLTDEINMSILPADALYSGVNMDLMRSKLAEAIGTFSTFSTEATDTIDAIVGKFDDDIAGLNTAVSELVQKQSEIQLSISALEDLNQ